MNKLIVSLAIALALAPLLSGIAPGPQMPAQPLGMIAQIGVEMVVASRAAVTTQV